MFTLEAKCERLANGGMSGDVVYAEDLEWVPQGRQAQRPELKIRPPKALAPKIIIAKLRPGQEIEAELHVIKGLGKEHAKWSPVCTASYRLMPDVTITRPIKDEEADKLVAKCPMGVFDIEDLGLQIWLIRICWFAHFNFFFRKWAQAGESSRAAQLLDVP